MYTYLPPKSNDLNQFYELHDIKRHPTFMRCKIQRENYQSVCLDRQKPFKVEGNCPEIIEPSAPAGRHGNVMKYVDIDSELKGHNRRADKCYYNNYVIDPLSREAETAKSPLVCHKDVFKINEMQSYEKNEENRLIDRNMVPRPCAELQQFPLCKNTPVTNKQIKMYDFGQRDYCAQYPCQKVFNNVTKRKMYPNSYTPQDLNRIHSSVDYTDLEKRNNDHSKVDRFFDEDLMCMPYSMTTEYGTQPEDCKPTPVKLRYY